ncbi:hypothetical protein [Streptomyces rapamycinicus]|uniref:Uncharacterized protein n=1 Tax=Streptomyces rapamycinicus TaxID=1226757 RepID=A0ABR6LH31_9ACTN|nr:hypothetical protein [Streptomyces rapamycinicus]MBB4780724.1 hypothetical protein [Streptomyces rapamycinicus]UTO61424.1 hypothetical protein LJB45_03135 [Streptomyces rapamycinicus]UTP29371.1 hypothetical protein LIV37_08255 [Streptomyces rapamycinicus NRRL 5491]
MKLVVQRGAARLGGHRDPQQVRTVRRQGTGQIPGERPAPPVQAAGARLQRLDEQRERLLRTGVRQAPRGVQRAVGRLVRVLDVEPLDGHRMAPPAGTGERRRECPVLRHLRHGGRGVPLFLVGRRSLAADHRQPPRRQPLREQPLHGFERADVVRIRRRQSPSPDAHACDRGRA